MIVLVYDYTWGKSGFGGNSAQIHQYEDLNEMNK
jgi:hypothetical protein